MFWLVVLIVLLGLIFGGYRKGSPVTNNNPGSARLGAAAAAARPLGGAWRP